ncbi:hypothetical protein JOQ06_022164 [Pogonophryne albipinna]|uniref:Core-binding (CB) domain-containing protein n=1 Tax=Pogonophryne albipinna TaxID=1090488 RepID=A0AAD6A6L5_9TELE|nr:hypothetical protein JOQ06_022164 [Pogonophryne albipinna]
MKSHTELCPEAKKTLLSNLKRRLILGTLRTLRVSNPAVPMVSSLDLEEAARGQQLLEHSLPGPLEVEKEIEPFGKMQFPPFPDHIPVLNAVLEDYREMQEGPDPSAKLKNNVQSKLHRIRNCMAWMSQGKSGLAKMQFMGDQNRIRGWVKYLTKNGMALTTTLHYLKNVRQFFEYLKETPPKNSCLSQLDLLKVIREVKMSISSWNRPVVLHQMKIKGQKDAAMHTIKEHQDCRKLALVAIPKLISKLESDFSHGNLWKLYGYVTAYLASLYGHRLGVFMNMTDVEVSQAVHGPEKDDYLIKMSNHKTSESFGTAKMLLSSGEYGWLLSLMKLKRDAGKKSTFVFCNTTLKTTEKLTTYLQNAWSDMKLKGVPTFISLRSAVATFARDRHGEDSQARKSMARLMCRDTLTADKHYAMDLNVQQAREGRLLFEQAQETTKSRTRPQSEEEEEEEGDKGEEKGDEEQESGTSSRMKKSTPRMTRSQAGKVKCRVLLSPLKISPRKRSHRSRVRRSRKRI